MSNRLYLSETHPNLIIEKWDKAENDKLELYPHKISRGSTKKAWWRCTEGHSWLAAVSSVVKGHGCSYCAGKAVLEGFNDLATVQPETVESLWDWDENNKREIYPNRFTKSSGSEANWSCRKCTYRWKARIVDVTRGYGCSVCGNNKVVPGINDIFTIRPDLRCKLNKDLNTNADMSRIGCGNTKEMLWWDCEKGHPYKSTTADLCKGAGCGVCRGMQVHEGYNDLATLYPKVASRWNYELNGDLLPTQVSYGSGKYAWFTCDNGHDNYIYIPDSYRYGCNTCVSKVSKPEIEVREYIQSLVPGEEVIANTRKVISPKEIDIYIPSRNLAVEFNGIFSHSDYFRPRSGVDALKARMVRGLGIQFHAVWEDDWRDRTSIVRRQLAYKLGLNTDREYARNCVVELIEKEKAQLFLDNNHIQGYHPGTIYIGLKGRNRDLIGVSVFTFTKTGVVELNRYATSRGVVGGMSKIVSYLEKTYSYEHLVTFADLQESTGELYKKTGWLLDKELPPDYKYLVGMYRENKRNYRVKNFKKDPTLKYMEGMTEAELAEYNKLTRVYDYGKLRFVKTHPGRTNDIGSI